MTAVAFSADYRPDICIYHANCDDGFGAAFAVWKNWGDSVQFVPASYGQWIDFKPLADKHVLMVDFSLSADFMRLMSHVAKSVIVLDHHKSAQESLHQWIFENVATGRPFTASDMRIFATADLSGVHAVFDMEKSGARLAWEFCHPNDDGIPPLLAAIEDRDLWRFKMPNTKAISAALRFEPRVFSVWDALDVPDMTKTGRAILRHIEARVAEFVEQRHHEWIDGHLVPMVNVPYAYGSDCCAAMLAAEPEAPFVGSWFLGKEGRIHVSLRSTNERMDVSIIAQKFGGGGHRNAAGFTTD